MSFIECESIYGRRVPIQRERLTFRPSVYGVITEANKVLLVKTRSTGNYDFPGGGIDIGEPIEIALKREVWEEAGIEVEVEKLLHFEEGFFYYDPIDTAWHTLQFFYRCRPVTFQLRADDQVDDEEAMQPRWLDLQSLSADQFRPTAGRVLQLLQRATSLSSAV
jgi:8-oxo-dGTP pyrophosphatase MutT (NUDIX family)